MHEATPRAERIATIALIIMRIISAKIFCLSVIGLDVEVCSAKGSTFEEIYQMQC